MKTIELKSKLSTEDESSSTFQLAYGGPAVAGGSMTVSKLAPALTALNDFIELSNVVLNGEESKIELRVLADFESGSFDVNFLLHHVLKNPAVAMLPTLEALTAKQILDAAIGTYQKTKVVVSGVAKIYKALRGEKPKEVRSGEQINTRIIVFGNNNTIVTDINSARLYDDDRIRNALTRAAEPLASNGIDSMSLKRNDEIVETLKHDDVGTIQLSQTSPSLSPDSDKKTRDIWVRVVKPNFDGGRWRFHDGSASFGAELEDSDFQAKVNGRQQGFYKGDAFLIRLRSTQHIDKNGGITTANVVEKVLGQREGARQQKLLP